DEIGQLARAFNVMAENLRRAQGELRAWAAELERRVEERTEALRVSEEQYRRIVETASQDQKSATHIIPATH
ncbi:MAG: HAMP domain-containing protein, partial [Kiritimatiellaeota bacterium]|nr:HAMP domain-containing protein [Kiritimatiellota bacterium]